MQTLQNHILQRSEHLDHKLCFKLDENQSKYRLTYTEFRAEIEKATAILIDIGIRPGHRVILLTENRPEAMIAYFAVLAAGGSAVLLDITYPRAELKKFIEIVDSCAILASEKGLAAIDPLFIPSLAVRHIQHQFSPCEGFLSQVSVDFSSYQASDSEVATIVFTSGTSGHAKAVMLTHENLITQSQSGQAAIELTEKDSMLTFLPIHHVTSLIQNLVGLHSGGTLIFVEKVEGPVILSTLQIMKPTYMGAVPLLLDLFLKNIEDEIAKKNKLTKNIIKSLLWTSQKIRRFTSINVGFYVFKKIHQVFGGHLKCIVSGGAAAKPSVIKKLEGFGFSILEAYGLTETTGPICSNKLNHSFPGSVGKSFPNMMFSIRDGEICVKGPLVMKGYFNDPIATQDAIRDGWFHTGDLGRIDKKNFVTITGRRREMIILSSGKKTIPTDVEAQYQNIPGVAELAVFGMSSLKQAGEEISAAVVLNSEFKKSEKTKSIEEAILQRAMQLSPTLQIQHVFFIDELPKTAMKKIKRTAIKEMIEEKYRNPFFNTQTLPEQKKSNSEIQVIISELLTQAIGETIHDLDKNIFSYGIHSLKAIEIVSKISDQFHTDITDVSFLYKHPTVRSITHYIENKSHHQTKQTIKKYSENRIFHPVSFAQYGLWLIDQNAAKNSYYYNLPFVVHLSGKLNEQALQYALDGLIERHTVLRSVFILKNEKLWQKIIPFKTIEFEKKNVTHDEMNKEIEKASIHPFDLEAGPLYDFKLYRIENKLHVLFANIHHIVCDGTSARILIHDFEELYNAAAQNRTAKLSSLALVYSDFCYWQEKQFPDEALKKDFDYWKNKLSGIEPLSLPIDYARPARKEHVTDTIRFEIHSELTSKLLRFSKNNECTLFIVLNAIFSILLSRHCNENIVTFGSPVSDRNNSDFKNVVGLFINLLVFKNDHSKNISFIDFVQQVKQTCMEIYEHQALPFWKLAHAILRERDFSRHPIVQVILNFQSKLENINISLNEMSTEIIKMPSTFSDFDLALSIKELDDKLVCDFEFDTALFNKSTIQSMAEHIVNISHSVMDDPLQAIHQIQLFSDAEYNAIVVDLNKTEINQQIEDNLYLLFEKQALKTPHSIAVVHNENRISYGELAKRVSHVSNSIRELKSFHQNTSNKFIIIKLDRGISFIISMLAVLKSGYAFITIAPDYPEERIRCITDETKPLCMIDEDFFGILLNDESQIFASPFTHYEIASVIYTSGSTGKPKGVMDTHKNILRITTNNSLMPIEQDMQVSQTSSATFDGFLYEIFFSLLNGGTLHIADKDILLSSKMTAWVQKNKITHMFLTTALCKYYTEHELLLFSLIRYLVVGGEQLDSSIIHSIFNYPAHHTLQMSNIYGPTETGIWATIFSINKQDTYRGPIPIGKPVTNTSCYVLDRNKQLCPMGTIGELYIGGDGVSPGYLANQEQNAKSFIENPFVTHDEKSRHYNTTIYRTGDRVRRLSDGNLIFINRTDNQIKLNGFRVDLAEIEQILQLHPEVNQCIVLVHHEGEYKSLTAYIKNHSRMKFNENSLRNHVKKYLPNYMVPANFIVLDYFPMNSNGKVDKKKIAEIYQGKINRNKPIKIPQTINEKLIHSIWCEVFPTIKEISMDDNFFSLGGNSLLAGIIIAKIGEKSKISLPLNIMFTHPTIEQMSEVLEKMRSNNNSQIAFDIKNRYQSKIRRFDKILLRTLLIPFLRTFFSSLASISITGLEHIPDKGPLIVTCNHTNFMDTPLLLSMLGTLLGKISNNPGFIASTRRKKALHWFFKWIGEPIYMSRGYEGRDMDSLMQAADILKSDGMVCLSPEGTFNDEGRLIRARPGVGFLAANTQAPILPIAIYGHECPFKKWKRFQKLMINIHIGPCVKKSDWPCSSDFQKLSDTVMLAIAEMMPEKYHGHYYHSKQTNNFDRAL